MVSTKKSKIKLTKKLEFFYKLVFRYKAKAGLKKFVKSFFYPKFITFFSMFYFKNKKKFLKKVVVNFNISKKKLYITFLSSTITFFLKKIIVLLKNVIYNFFLEKNFIYIYYIDDEPEYVFIYIKRFRKKKRRQKITKVSPLVLQTTILKEKIDNQYTNKQNQIEFNFVDKITDSVWFFFHDNTYGLYKSYKAWLNIYKEIVSRKKLLKKKCSFINNQFLKLIVDETTKKKSFKSKIFKKSRIITSSPRKKNKNYLNLDKKDFFESALNIVSVLLTITRINRREEAYKKRAETTRKSLSKKKMTE